MLETGRRIFISLEVDFYVCLEEEKKKKNICLCPSVFSFSYFY